MPDLKAESDTGAMTAAFKSAFAAYERRQISARMMMRGKEEKRRQGKHVAGANA